MPDIIRQIAFPILVLTAALLACTANPMPAPTPSPMPTATPIPAPTPNQEATVDARVADRMATTSPQEPAAQPTHTPKPAATLTPRPTATPVPTHTPKPTATSVPTPTAQRLQEVECRGCQMDYEPVFSRVDWIQKPQVSADGRFSLIAKVDAGYDITIPGLNGGAANVVFSDGPALYGSVLPPGGPGWSWNPVPNQWIASTYEYRNRTLTVVAQVAPAVATHPGLRVCLWTGSTRSDILDCVGIDKR